MVHNVFVVAANPVFVVAANKHNVFVVAANPEDSCQLRTLCLLALFVVRDQKVQFVSKKF